MGGEEASMSLTNSTCTVAGIEQFLDTYRGLDGAIRAAYDHCTEQFLANNQVSVEVKRTVDDWIGVDLAEADPDEVFLAYQLAIISPRPAGGTSHRFDDDCEQMFESFEAYRDTVEPLTYYYSGDSDDDQYDQADSLNRLLVVRADDARKLDDQDRQLIKFVQYTQLCKSLMQGNADVDTDDDDDDLLEQEVI